MYKLTDNGSNLELAQQVFALIYILTLALVLFIYNKAKVCPINCLLKF